MSRASIAVFVELGLRAPEPVGSLSAGFSSFLSRSPRLTSLQLLSRDNVKVFARLPAASSLFAEVK